MRSYLEIVQSKEIRNFITRLRTDNNCSFDSRVRAHRGKKPLSNLCPHCKVKHTVEHILFECSKSSIVKIRNQFYEEYKKYNENFHKKTTLMKIQEVLCLDPVCYPKYDEVAIKCICNFLKHIMAEMSKTLLGAADKDVSQPSVK